MDFKNFIKKLFFVTWLALTTFLFYLAISPYKTNFLTKEEVYFSPDDQPQHKLLSLINNSSKNIKIAIYTFTNTKLANALIEAKNRGVNIEIVADKSTLSGKFTQINKLASHNIPIHIFPPEDHHSHVPLMHNKFALFESNKKILCTGSLNWTKSACKRNRENIIILENDNIYRKYERQFRRLQKVSSPLKVPSKEL